MTQPLEIVLILRKSSMRSNSSTTQDSRQSHQFLDLCPLRKRMIAWLYCAQHAFKTNRSTLFIAISMLDRLITTNFHLQEPTHELVCATIIIMAAKFNEIYPPRMTKVFSLIKDGLDHNSEQFVNMEALILGKLDYNIVDQFDIYESLSQIEHKYAVQHGQRAQKIVEIALSRPNLFRYGAVVLRKATEKLVSGTTIGLEDQIHPSAKREIGQISSQLSMEYEFYNHKAAISNI